MSHYKRRGADREVTFRAPDHECLVCNDTGLVTNGDRLLTDSLGDYDVNPETGTFQGGSDCVVVCRCHAAYPSYGENGEITKQGFRNPDGSLRQIDTEQGPRVIGFDCPADVFKRIHEARKASWENTALEMNAKRAVGDKSPSEWMQAGREAMKPETWRTTNSGFSPLSASLPSF